MDSLSLLITIISRSLTKKFIQFYEEAGLDVSFISVGKGTAASELLHYFGLEGAEKSVLFHVVTAERWKSVKRQLQVQMKIDVPGVGVAFLVPMSSIGGKKALQYLTDGQGFVKKEESALKDTKYELLVTIANQGYVEQIMDAARKLKAPGGTVIHARGTGSEKAEKFLGVTLVPEKEMLFIVVRTERKNAIMEAIMAEAGRGAPAGAIVFSLPVTDTAGMRLVEAIEELEETQAEEAREAEKA